MSAPMQRNGCINSLAAEISLRSAAFQSKEFILQNRAMILVSDCEAADAAAAERLPRRVGCWAVVGSMTGGDCEAEI